MKHFINLKDIPAKDLRKIIIDAKKRKNLRKKLSTLEVDRGSPLKGKILIQMFEKASSRTRISFYLAIKQLGGGTLTLRSNELHLGQGGESISDTAKILSTYGDGFMLRTVVQRAVSGRRRTYRAHGRISPYLSSNCHVEFQCYQKTKDVKKADAPALRLTKKQAAVKRLAIGK